MLAARMHTRSLVLVVLGLALACSKSAPETASPDAGASAPDSFDDLEAELGRYEGELRTQTALRETGNVPADAGAEPGASANAEDTTRPRVCELADAICGLKDRICALADEHDDEERYTNTCDRAKGDCETATEACDAQD